MLEHRHRRSRRFDLPGGLRGGAGSTGGEQEGLAEWQYDWWGDLERLIGPGVTRSWPWGPMRSQILHPRRPLPHHRDSCAVGLNFSIFRNTAPTSYDVVLGRMGGKREMWFRVVRWWQAGRAEKVVNSWKYELMSKRNACVQLDYRAPSLGGVRARRPCRPRLSPD
jgi:hypothetical protein